MTTELQQQALNKIEEVRIQLEQLYLIKFPELTVSFDINSTRIAGLAYIYKNKVRFNNHFLEKYKEEFINITVPHEIAHIGACVVYGYNIRAHGPEWKRMMLRLGCDPNRCHTYVADVTSNRTSIKHLYTCNKCGESIPVGDKIHKNIINGLNYTHIKCGGQVLQTGQVLGKIGYSEAAQIIADGSLVTKTNKVMLPVVESKFEKCWKLFQTNSNLSRSQLIELFMTEAGCTKAGASTYLHTCRKKFKNN